jgi:4-hydroxy-2-oxoglutarate aldolase
VSAEFKVDEFFSLAGQSDWLLPALAVGSIGSITGLANVYPLVSSPSPHHANLYTNI